MYLNLFKVQLKIIKRSLWIYIMLVGVGLLSLLSYYYMLEAGVPSVGVWINISTYPILYGVLCFIMLGIEVGRDNDEYLNTLNINYIKFVCVKLLAIYIIALVLLIIPIGIIIFNSVVFKGLSLKLFINLLLEIIFIWGIAFMVAGTLGFFSGNIIKSKFSYILGVVFWYISSPYFFNTYSNNYGLAYKSISLLNLCIYDINNLYDQTKSFVFDNFYIVDKIFSVILIVILVSLCIFKNNRTKFNFRIMKSKVFYVLFIAVMINSIILGYSIFIDIADAKGTTTSNSNIINNQLKVNSYDMDINLKGSLDNTCIVNLKNDGNNDINEIELALYEKLKIENIIIEDKISNYSFQNGVIRIKLDNYLKPGELINIQIEYGGKISIVDNIGNEIIYTHNNATYLDDTIKWFPQIATNKIDLIDYNIKIESNNRCESTLYNVVETKQLNEYKYTMKGMNNQFAIIQGYIDKINSYGVEYIGSEEFINNKAVDYSEIKKIMSVDRFKSFKEVNKVLFVPYSSIDYKGKDFENTLCINGIELWNYISNNMKVNK